MQLFTDPGCSSPTTGAPTENPNLSIQDDAARYVMHMLAEHKQTQVEMQASMTVVDHLVKKALNFSLDVVKSLLAREECSHLSLISQLKAEELIPDLFAGLKSQYNQIAYFKKSFGLIMPTTITLPRIPQDFGRHKTRSRQSSRQQSYVCVSLIDQIEQLLNIDDIYTEIMEKPVIPQSSSCLCRYHIE